MDVIVIAGIFIGAYVIFYVVKTVLASKKGEK
jgi:uncharacterized membrane protein YdjX (TVP38/TMEM64 family)